MTLVQKTELEKKKSYLHLGLVISICFLLFVWASYKLVASQMYYHVTVEQYLNDNQTITEAFKEETAMRRHFQQRLAKKKVEVEQQNEKIVYLQQELESHELSNSVMQKSYNQLQLKYQRAKYEKDSLTAVIASLRRVH